MYERKNTLNAGHVVLLFFMLCIIIQVIRYSIYENGRYHINSKEKLIQYVIKDEAKLDKLVNSLVNSREFFDKKRISIYYYTETSKYYKNYNNELLNEIFYNYKVSNLYAENEKSIYVKFSLMKRSNIAHGYGFYYTEDDKPRAWQIYDEDRLIVNGNGYIDKKEKEYYTEKIINHWYYYQINNWGF